MVRFVNGKWVRQYPTKKGTFDCNKSNLVDIKANLNGSSRRRTSDELSRQVPAGGPRGHRPVPARPVAPSALDSRHGSRSARPSLSDRRRHGGMGLAAAEVLVADGARVAVAGRDAGRGARGGGGTRAARGAGHRRRQP